MHRTDLDAVAGAEVLLGRAGVPPGMKGLQPMKRVRELAARAGFREQRALDGLLAYTISFLRAS